jgi:regulator of sigma E protease
MKVLRKGQELAVTVTPIDDPNNPGVGLVGIRPGNPEKDLNKEAVGTAFANAPVRTFNLARAYVLKLKELGGKVTTGNVHAVRRDLGGPVGIAQIAYRQAQNGLDDWLNFLIILNVALAVMNILPFPVLDGGHICFAIYEGIFRKPVPPKILVPLLNGAVVFILIFFVLVTFNDIWKIFI